MVSERRRKAMVMRMGPSLELVRSMRISILSEKVSFRRDLVVIGLLSAGSDVGTAAKAAVDADDAMWTSIVVVVVVV